MNTASVRKTKWGYKPLIIRANGSTYQPVRKTFADRVSAREYAQRWVDANAAYDQRMAERVRIHGDYPDEAS